MRTTSLLIALMGLSACGSNSDGGPGGGPSKDASPDVEPANDALDAGTIDAMDAIDALDARKSPDALPEGGACPTDFTRYLPQQTPTNCPQLAPLDRVSCEDIPLYGQCVWQDPMGYVACTCYESMAGKEWKCFGGNNGTLRCPLSPPENGKVCAGLPQINCAYPNESCSCMGNPGAVWNCKPEQLPLPREVQRACPPAGVDESKVIKDLTDAELRAWCEWYADPTEVPQPDIHPQLPDDTSVYPGYGQIDVVGDGLSGCVSDLPVLLCMKNVRLQACTATLKELDDCVETLVAGSTLSGAGVVGMGCAPYRRNPTCDRTIVVTPTPVGSRYKCYPPIQ